MRAPATHELPRAYSDSPWVYRRSGGRVLGRLGGQPVLLLQTTGRHSGQTRTTPVQERTELWDKLIATTHYLQKVQTKAERQLPLIIVTTTAPRRRGDC